jgi:hypothetical protein
VEGTQAGEDDRPRAEPQPARFHLGFPLLAPAGRPQLVVAGVAIEVGPVDALRLPGGGLGGCFRLVGNLPHRCAE